MKIQLKSWISFDFNEIPENYSSILYAVLNFVRHPVEVRRP